MKRLKTLMYNKTVMIILIVLLMVLVAGAGTYAWLTWRSTDNPTLTTTIGDIYTVTFETGSDINATLYPVFDYKEGYNTNFIIESKEVSAQGLFTVELNIDEINDSVDNSSIKYLLINDNDKIIGTGSLKDATSGDTINILSNSLLLSGTHEYTFYLYMDGNVENDTNMIDNTFFGNINVVVSEGTMSGAEYINYLYTMDDKEAVNNNTGANQVTYSYAVNENLMKDRFGDLNNPEDSGNLRYYGSNPNNYIYFNCDSYPSNNCELWRIIGVFDGKLKIIRNNPFDENIAWDYDMNDDGESETYSNSWNNSSLKDILNDQYYNGNDDIINYYSFSYNDGNLEVEIDMSNYQLKNNETRNLILNENWYIKPMGNLKLYADAVYKNERDNTTNIWNGKVGLVSASDYAYSTDFRNCISQVSSYNSASCQGNSWLNNSTFWTMISGSGTSNVYAIKSTGQISTAQARIGNSYGVRPVVYLDSNIEITNGTGEEDFPFRIINS